MQHMPSYITLSDEVRTAIEERRPVVVLESTVIAHGLPHPTNIEVALSMEATIRAEGAVPPTVGVHDGKISIAVTPRQIEHLGTNQPVVKVSRPNLALTLA